MISVAKFGGTSVGSAEKLMYAARIIKEVTPESRYITVSAPALGDKRMTNMLRELADCESVGDVFNEAKYMQISDWFLDIAYGVKLESFLLEREIISLHNLVSKAKKSLAFESPKHLAAIESFGEKINAKCMAAALRANGLKAIVLDPLEIGLMTNSEYGNAQPLKKCFPKIREKLRNLDDYIVIPGYYGYTKDGDVATFSRGGTDLTGAILAASLGVDKYQIFKDDVEGVCTANPKIVPKAKTLEEITYKEMREMAYLGTEVVHQDVMKLCRDNQIPIIIRGTNNLSNSWTKIVAERDLAKNPIVGITKKDGFTFFTIEQMGMNESIGYLNSVLTIFNEENVSVDHMTTSIDSISLSVHKSHLNGQRSRVYKKLQNRLNPDKIIVSDNQSLICVVGEGMKQRIGTFSAISSALAQSKINIKTVYQTPSEGNIIIGVNEKDSDNAVMVLHNKFFG